MTERVSREEIFANASVKVEEYFVTPPGIVEI